jgi:hypothetical protein
MFDFKLKFNFPYAVNVARSIGIGLAVLCVVSHSMAQETPLLSGGVGFLTGTNAGNTSYTPIIEPLLAAPIGNRILIESRAAVLESFTPKGNGQTGYDHSHFAALTYLQGDFAAASHLTLVGGSFLLPFGSYNERLTPIWISNFQDGPLAIDLGLMSTGVGLGGMARGSLVSRPGYSLDYAAYFSTRSGNEQFNAKRSSGGRTSLYLPDQRLELGFSYGRLLQGASENFYGTHLWWQPKGTAVRLRSEYNRGQHTHGYWIEADYRTQAFGGTDSFIGRFEPVFRIQQTWRRDTLGSDGLPPVDIQRVDFGLNYNLPHNARLLASYSRQFSSAGNKNVWETGIVYRFLFPAWKGK